MPANTVNKPSIIKASMKGLWQWLFIFAGLYDAKYHTRPSVGHEGSRGLEVGNTPEDFGDLSMPLQESGYQLFN